MYELYGEDGSKTTVRTMADRKEYIASGFYSDQPFTSEGKRVEDKGVKVEAVDIEDAEFTEVEEDEAEEELSEEQARELYLEKFGKKAGNMSFEKIKSKLAE